jgi:plasmid stabilization system protein ParE
MAVKHSGEWGELHETLEAAAEEITNLREAIRRLADQDATLSVCNGNVTVTMDATLTDEEREAIEYFGWQPWSKDAAQKAAATLRALLKRLG